MSTASLPTYSRPVSFDRAPSYNTAPQVASMIRVNAQTYLPSGAFIKESKGGHVILRLGSQEGDKVLPIYGLGSVVEGTIELPKAEPVESVEVKIEGRLLMQEIAGSGTASANLCLDSMLLWSRDTSDAQCPHSLPFSLALPDTFTYEGVTYPLPPSFDVKLSGLPGFTATIEYSVIAIVAKPLSIPIPTFTVKALRIHFGTTIVSTAFAYYPRSRPAKPLPAPLQYLQTVFEPFSATSEWELHEFTLQSRFTFRPDIVTKLYLPVSRTFSITQPIPFHLTMESTASISLVAFLPFSPTGNPLSARKVTRIQLMRQSTVDIQHGVVARTKGEMWRTDGIGEGTFTHVGDGRTWMSFSGQIDIEKEVKVTGFRAAGLSVKDCIVFSITPLDMTNSAFNELRAMIPVRLTTDPALTEGNISHL